jgi:hypothetical protein
METREQQQFYSPAETAEGRCCIAHTWASSVGVVCQARADVAAAALSRVGELGSMFVKLVVRALRRGLHAVAMSFGGRVVECLRRTKLDATLQSCWAKSDAKGMT